MFLSPPCPPPARKRAISRLTLRTDLDHRPPQKERALERVAQPVFEEFDLAARRLNRHRQADARASSRDASAIAPVTKRVTDANRYIGVNRAPPYVVLIAV